MRVIARALEFEGSRTPPRGRLRQRGVSVVEASQMAEIILNVDVRDGDVEQCRPGQKDNPKGLQRHSSSILSYGERMCHRRLCIDSSMEIRLVAQLLVEEGNDGLEYYYDIVVIKLSAESDGDAADCSHHR